MAKQFTLNRTGATYTIDTGNFEEGGVYGQKIQSFLSDIVDTANATAGGLQIEASPNYLTPTSGQTVAMSTSTSNNIINPAGTLAALTVTLPASPVDGQVCRVLFTQTITALTLTGCTPAITTANAGTTLTFRYRTASATWFRG